MKRIDSEGCGYVYGVTGLTCTAVPKLDPLFANTIISAATTEVGNRDVWVWPESGRPSQATVDNYAQIPQSFEGFVMTMEPIIDMSGGSGYAEVPEIACRVNTDPFSTQKGSVLNPSTDYTADIDTINSGFIDLFNQVDQYKQNVYVSVASNTDAHLRYTIPMMVDVTDGSTVNSVYTVKPGILDPMVDTMMPDVGVKTIPAIDAGLDGVFLALDRLQMWRSTIDTRITNLTIAKPNIFPQDSPCDNFNIELRSGEPYQPDIREHESNDPWYSISDGNIKINGIPVAVTGMTGVGDGAIVEVIDGATTNKLAVAPFAVYLRVTSDNGIITADKMVYRQTSPEKDSDYQLYYIGGVTKVFKPRATGSTVGDVLYQIDQGDCIEDIEYITGQTSGYMYLSATTEGRQYTTDQLLDYSVFQNDIRGNTNYNYRGVQAGAIQEYVLAHGGGSTVTADWVGYPNYAAYGADTYDTTSLENIVFGDAWLLPVSSGAVVTYMTGATTGHYAAYAPSLGSETVSVTGATPMTKDIGLTALANGWVRIRVFDDGNNKGKCLRFGEISGETATVDDWNNLTPVYRFGDFPTEQIITTPYNGPFKVDGDGSISCPACLNEGPTVGGHYWLNGIEDKIVDVETVPLTAATQNLYIHITGTTTYTIDTTKTTGNTNAYTVWLAHIYGATVTGSTIDVPIEGSTETEAVALYGGGTVTQIQHGDIYVDGRWM